MREEKGFYEGPGEAAVLTHENMKNTSDKIEALSKGEKGERWKKRFDE